MNHVYIGERIILSGCLIVNENKEILLLYRKDHHHYETPGGKVRLNECNNPDKPSIEDLAKTAKRELYEELGEEIQIEAWDYFDKVEFVIPDGRLSIANKFLIKLRGKPRINEPDKFSRLDYLPIKHLEDYSISPDLKLLLPKLKEYMDKNL